MKNIKIGLGQLLIEGGEPDRNFNRAKDLIIDAKKNNCSLILLPECLDFGWTHPSGINNSKTIPGEFSNILCDEAKKMKFIFVQDLLKKTM